MLFYDSHPRWISIKTYDKLNNLILGFWFQKYKVVAEKVWYFVLLNYSFKSWSIIKTRDSFRICLSWGFQNTPWKLNLMKIWLSKSRSKAFYPFLNNVCYGISYEWNHRENMIFYAKIFSQIESNSKHYLEMDQLSLKLIYSAKSWSNWTSRGCFGILRTSRF